MTKPFPAGAPESLRAALGAGIEVTLLDEREHRWSPARPTLDAWRSCPRWCEENDVLPESLTLGQRTLEDVFLELTGRELAP